MPPLVRENRLYQADWLLRYYNFKVNDLLDNNNPNFNILLDPKTDWALRHLEEYPKEINKASYYDLLRVPGIGPTSAKKIVSSRKYFIITFDDLKKMNVSLKKAKYFILCNGKYFAENKSLRKETITTSLLLENKESTDGLKQLSLFE